MERANASSGAANQEPQPTKGNHNANKHFPSRHADHDASVRGHRGARFRRTGCRMVAGRSGRALQGHNDPHHRRGVAAARGDEEACTGIREADRHQGRDRDVRSLGDREQGDARPQLEARPLRLHPPAAPQCRQVRHQRPCRADRAVHDLGGAARSRLQAGGAALPGPLEGNLLVRRQGLRLPVHGAHHVRLVSLGPARRPEGEGRLQGEIRLRPRPGAGLEAVSRHRRMVHPARPGALRHRAAGQAPRGAVVRVAELPLFASAATCWR